MQIRALTPDDAPAVARLFARSRGAGLPWLPVLHTPEEDVAYFADQLRSGIGLGVDDGQDLTGFAIVRPDWLDHLYVEPDARGRGIGSALLTAAREAVSGELQLWVFARNIRALTFYRGHGAIEVERTAGAGNEEREPDVRLVLPAVAAGSAS